jgi:hypothetical protein
LLFNLSLSDDMVPIYRLLRQSPQVALV